VQRHVGCSIGGRFCQHWNTTTFIVVLLTEWSGNGSRRLFGCSELGALRVSVAPPLRAISTFTCDPGTSSRGLLGGTYCERETDRASGQRSDGEFGWGGTPVTQQHRRPEAPLRLNRNHSRRSRPKVLLMRRFTAVRIQNAQAWPSDPLAPSVVRVRDI